MSKKWDNPFASDSDDEEVGCFGCLGCCLCILVAVGTIALSIKIWRWGMS